MGMTPWLQTWSMVGQWMQSRHGRCSLDEPKKVEDLASSPCEATMTCKYLLIAAASDAEASRVNADDAGHEVLDDCMDDGICGYSRHCIVAKDCAPVPYLDQVCCSTEHVVIKMAW